jgi:hypothetical protein
MALGSTQPVTKMSTKNLPSGKERPARKADNFTDMCETTVYNMWEPRRLTTLWASTACYRDSFTFFTLMGYNSALAASRPTICHNATATTASLLLATFLLTSHFQSTVCTLKVKCNRWRGDWCIGLLSVASVYEVAFIITLGCPYVTSKYPISRPISLHHLAADVPFTKISCAICVKVKVRHALRAEYFIR